jgi:hypothetical protein
MLAYVLKLVITHAIDITRLKDSYVLSLGVISRENPIMSGVMIAITRRFIVCNKSMSLLALELALK